MQKLIKGIKTNMVLRLLMIFISTGLVVAVGLSCNDSRTPQNPSRNPILGIIGIFFEGTGIDPDTLLPTLEGNACEDRVVRVEVNEEFPDGSVVEFSIGGVDIGVAGCLFDASSFIINGQAFATYLPFPNLTDVIQNVAIAVTITTPDGFSQSDFTQVIVEPVFLVAQDDSASLTVPFCPNDVPTTIVLTFDAMGLENCGDLSVSFDRSLGTITAIGPLGDTITIGYTAKNGAGGIQIITITIVLPNPASVDPSCPNVPLADRTIFATVVIEQTVGEAPTDDEGFVDCSGVIGPVPTEAQCTDGLDNDADGAIDCDDGDCAADPICEFPEATCDDGFDNDADGDIDCADTDDCSGSGFCGPESDAAFCSDFVDNDADGDIDCEDADCDMVDIGGGIECEFGTETGTNCDDTFDNDADGLVDCEELSCNGEDGEPGAGMDTCQFNFEIDCDDEFDNDADGLEDCLDPNCDGQDGDPSDGAVCEFGTETLCADGFDNDGDGLIDGADSDC
ncbi:MAG: hypothetical protein IH874_01020 [Candidatus Dadabacteria bacterium]|nr:hypothetical protein [Candidatus Dadabacteria bacterium]